MKSKTALTLGGALVLVMGLSGAAMAHGGKGKGMRGGGPEQMLEQLDTNGDGAITRAEVDAAAAERFATADSDGDGLLSAEELTAAAESRQADRRVRGLERMIERLDENDDGLLSAEELAARNPADRMFDRLDENEDGTISAEELAEMTQHRGKRGMGRDQKGGEGDN